MNEIPGGKNPAPFSIEDKIALAKANGTLPAFPSGDSAGLSKRELIAAAILAGQHHFNIDEAVDVADRLLLSLEGVKREDRPDDLAAKPMPSVVYGPGEW